MITAKQYIDKAAGYLGTAEGSYYHKQIIDAYNTISPRPADYKLTYTDAWCAGFVSAVAWMLQIPRDKFPYECSVARMVSRAQELKIWVEDESVKPNPGWLAIYSWKDANPSGDNHGAPNHVGIVQKVTAKNIYVIEGNYSNSVKVRQIAINARYLRGFVALKFSKASNGSDLDIAQEVIDGKWGNGAARKKALKAAGYDPEKIQKLVNKLLK